MKDKLHQLIQSLTVTEKRYFKIFVSRTNRLEEKKYLRLFEIFESVACDDELGLVKKLSISKYPMKHISADKNYLFELVLECLRLFHDKNSTYALIHNLLLELELLYERGLYEICQQHIRKIKKLIIDIEWYPAEFEITYWEDRIHSSLQNVKDFEDNFKRQNEIFKQIDEMHTLEYLHFRAQTLRRKTGKLNEPHNMKEFDALMSDDLLIRKDGEFSFIRSKLKYWQCWAAYQYCKNNVKEEYDANMNMLLLMQENSKFMDEYPMEYVSIFNRVLILSKIAAPDRYQTLLEEFKQFPTKVKRDKLRVEAQVFVLAYGTEMLRLIDKGDFLSASNSIGFIQSEIKRFGTLVDDIFLINMYYKFAYAEYAMGKTKKALDYLNIIANDFPETLRPDIQGMAKLLSIAIHSHLNNFALLRYYAKNAANFLKKHKIFLSCEELFLTFIKKIIITKNDYEFKNELKSFKSQLLNLFNEDPKAKISLRYFDYIAWVDAVVSGTNIYESKRNIAI
ncbi:MAG: hypothetical protein KA010_02055 [Saprospiraceae bacterium]|nr:hypothetical protein [Saprospiraceae bacterium]